MNLENIIKEGSRILEKNNIHSHKLDAEIIISNLMKIKKESLVTENKIDISKIFGLIAVVLASVNIFGGFIVTYRMLSMFKKKTRNKQEK